ncbi:hypothetical protein NG726_11485 [Pseudomonas sp. MOB-449]|nr:hypothetical protein [Pseudomonas sp. MOB-449]
MAAQGFLARVAGRTKQILGIQVSTGAADAGKMAALDDNGRWDISMMPVGVGLSTTNATATEALAAGDFVNLYGNAGAFSVRKADNSNNRPADGFVLATVANAATATVYPLDSANTGRSGLSIGADYWLGTAGAVTNTPLDETSGANTGKISQYLGKAKSATELLTTDDGYVVL